MGIVITEKGKQLLQEIIDEERKENPEGVAKLEEILGVNLRPATPTPSAEQRKDASQEAEATPAPSKPECVCGHAKDKHFPGGPCYPSCGCTEFRLPEREPAPEPASEFDFTDTWAQLEGPMRGWAEHIYKAGMARALSISMKERPAPSGAVEGLLTAKLKEAKQAQESKRNAGSTIGVEWYGGQISLLEDLIVKVAALSPGWKWETVEEWWNDEGEEWWDNEGSSIISGPKKMRAAFCAARERKG